VHASSSVLRLPSSAGHIISYLSRRPVSVLDVVISRPCGLIPETTSLPAHAELGHGDADAAAAAGGAGAAAGADDAVPEQGTAAPGDATAAGGGAAERAAHLWRPQR